MNIVNAKKLSSAIRDDDHFDSGFHFNQTGDTLLPCTVKGHAYCLMYGKESFRKVFQTETCSSVDAKLFAALKSFLAVSDDTAEDIIAFESKQDLVTLLNH